MTWTQESSGVISLSSAGDWLQNVLERRLLSKGVSNLGLTGATNSVGISLSTFVGSDRVQYELMLNE